MAEARHASVDLSHGDPVRARWDEAYHVGVVSCEELVGGCHYVVWPDGSANHVPVEDVVPFVQSFECRHPPVIAARSLLSR